MYVCVCVCVCVCWSRPKSAPYFIRQLYCSRYHALRVQGLLPTDRDRSRQVPLCSNDAMSVAQLTKLRASLLVPVQRHVSVLRKAGATTSQAHHQSHSQSHPTEPLVDERRGRVWPHIEGPLLIILGSFVEEVATFLVGVPQVPRFLQTCWGFREGPSEKMCSDYT
jgi:hypothetical protein